MQMGGTCDSSGAPSSSISALYAPLALVGATSQALDFGALAERCQRPLARLSSGRSGVGDAPAMAVVTVTASSPSACDDSTNCKPTLVVTQREGGNPETQLTRADSCKSNASAKSLAIQSPSGCELQVTSEQHQRPVRAILRNRLAFGNGGANSGAEAPPGGQAGRQEAAMGEPPALTFGLSAFRPQQTETNQENGSRQARSVAYDLAAKRNSDGKFRCQAGAIWWSCELAAGNR